MDNDVISETLIDQAGRIAALEANMTRMDEMLKEIDKKLDELLDLKSKGLGAISLIGIILGSGAAGIGAIVWNVLTMRPHL